ncbi:uncharacterized membrane protein YoaK (UPF0700 family) [Streptacidiphilus sp. MAP12-16]|uniref:YoaK family protein n=1 Tax=Streptacidiphilus sp. MAP12-16 TaxID=3156300 RepID=UPI0035192F4F
MNETRDHGPLPVLLLGLTVMTGLVDAFSYLILGHVFVANMTGNVLFAGFALTGLGGISWPATLLAVAAFAVGAAFGGRWGLTRKPHRGRLLAGAVVAQVILMTTAAIVASAAAVGDSPVRLSLIALLAVAMGIQNAIVRRLAVPDLTTTVLTLTVTGLFADTTPPDVRLRRIAGVLAMFGGAAAGGALLRWASIPAPLWLAAATLAVLAPTAFQLTRRSAATSWR